MLTALELIGASADRRAQPHRLPRLRGGRAVLARAAHRVAREPGTFDRSFDAPADTVVAGLDFLGEHRRDLPTQAFVFVLSDFIVPPDLRVWTRALEHRWEIVPVMIQDPVWERSFPDDRRDQRPVRRPAQRTRVPRLPHRA